MRRKDLPIKVPLQGQRIQKPQAIETKGRKRKHNLLILPTLISISLQQQLNQGKKQRFLKIRAKLDIHKQIAEARHIIQRLLAALKLVSNLPDNRVDKPPKQLKRPAGALLQPLEDNLSDGQPGALIRSVVMIVDEDAHSFVFSKNLVEFVVGHQEGQNV